MLDREEDGLEKKLEEEEATSSVEFEPLLPELSFPSGSGWMFGRSFDLFSNVG